MAQIVEFHLSPKAQQRAQMLMRKEKEQGLTATEVEELDFYIELGDFLGSISCRTGSALILANGLLCRTISSA